MFEKKSVLALIPARGGSKGIKNKNIIKIHNKPMIEYTIEAALDSKYIDKVLVSTDDEKIATLAEKCGADVPFLRPKELATDESKTIETVLHAVTYLKEKEGKYDILVLLQPTQPLRTVEDVDCAIELFLKKGQQGLVSISEVEDHPLLIREIDNYGRLKTILNENSTRRRQDMPKYYRVNGCIYINRVEEISEETSFNDNPIGFIMDKTHSVDVDEMKDVLMAEYYLDKRFK